MDERRSEKRLTEEEMEAIASRVKSQIMEDIYGEVGKAVLKRVAHALVIVAVGFLSYIGAKEGLWK